MPVWWGTWASADELALVLYGLKRGAANVEGIEIPDFILQTFAALPAIAGPLTVPNYVESFLAGTELAGGQARPHEPSLNTFRDLWNQALAQEAFMRHTSPVGPPSLSVLEPACGSANDYRFLDAYGWHGWWTTPGSTSAPRTSRTPALSSRASALPVGNVFEIAAPDKAFDLCLVHDLFEHLSLEGMEAP